MARHPRKTLPEHMLPRNYQPHARVRWCSTYEQWYVSRRDADGFWRHYDFLHGDWPGAPRVSGQPYTRNRHQADAVAEAFNALLALEQ